MYEAVYQVFEQVFGRTVFQRFVVECKEDFKDLKRNISVKLKTSEPDTYRLKIPAPLLQLFIEESKGTFKSKVIPLNHAESIAISDNATIEIDSNFWNNIFVPFIVKILARVDELFRILSIRGTTSLLLVGEFSEISFVQKAVRNTFPMIKVHSLEADTHAVGDGAVIMGHELKVASK